jgi:hypothetical protein
MDWDILAPMIGGVSFMLIVAITILLWPLSRRLGHLIEVIIQEKSRKSPPVDASIEELLVRMDARLCRLEEEQRFASALLGERAEPVRAIQGARAETKAAEVRALG